MTLGLVACNLPIVWRLPIAWRDRARIRARRRTTRPLALAALGGRRRSRSGCDSSATTTCSSSRRCACSPPARSRRRPRAVATATVAFALRPRSPVLAVGRFVRPVGRRAQVRAREPVPRRHHDEVGPRASSGATCPRSTGRPARSRRAASSRRTRSWRATTGSAARGRRARGVGSRGAGTVLPGPRAPSAALHRRHCSRRDPRRGSGHHRPVRAPAGAAALQYRFVRSIDDIDIYARGLHPPALWRQYPALEAAC